ncbi:MAG: His/Gly/Thr/Pro-type tRNA ligase C-terminal domain-containing protein, partial [Saprospiraceae bacterium]
VGISFGAERIYDVMEELGLFPDGLDNYIKVLFLVLDEQSHAFAFNLVMKLRSEGIATDLYPEPGKLKKQFKYAEDIKAENIVVIGENEQSTGQFALKNQLTGDTSIYPLESLIKALKRS